MSAMRNRILKTTHKYGIEIHTSVYYVYDIDKNNGGTFWRDVIRTKMQNNGLAFNTLSTGEQAPKGWHKVTGNLVFDVKMNFTRKTRWVLDGHNTPDPIGSTYAGVVSRESVRIAFTYAALNGLDVFVADIRNAFLQTPSSRKDYT